MEHIYLSISIIYMMLSKKLKIKKNKEKFNDHNLKNFLVWNGEKTNQQTLYILLIEDLKKNKEMFNGCTVVCLGLTEEEIEINCDLIFIKYYFKSNSDKDRLRILNYVMEVVNRFSEWKELIYDNIYNVPNLTMLLNKSKKIFNIQFIIIDNEYNYISFSEGFLEYNKIWTGTGNSGVLEIVNELNSDPDFIKTFGEKGVFISPNYIKTDILFGYNIFYKNEYQARLLAMVPLKDHYQGDKRIIEYLGKFITFIYQKYHDSTDEKKYNSLNETIYLMANGESFDKSNVEKSLYSRGWKTNHRYCVIKILLEGRDSTGVSKEFLCAQFEKIFESVCAIQSRNEIICVRNITMSNNHEKFVEKLLCFLRDSKCKAGISNEFENIYDLLTYCKQARFALMIGKIYQESLWYYYFSGFVKYYIKEQCLKEFTAEQICHPALIILKKYDEKEKSELYKTLYAFIKCKYNASHSADLLFIHRSTFLHRLRKINTLVSIDYDDYDEQLYLMLSFRLIEIDDNIIN